MADQPATKRKRRATPKPEPSPQVAETPKPTPRFTKEERERVAAWIAEKWAGAGCPFHGETTWQVGAFRAAIPPHIQAGGESTDRVYPSAAIVCNRCGFTALVNTNVIGVTLAAPEDE